MRAAPECFKRESDVEWDVDSRGGKRVKREPGE